MIPRQMMWFAKMGPVVPFLSNNASSRKILRTPEATRYRVAVFQSECIWRVLLLSRIPISKRRGKIAMHSLTKKPVEKWYGKVRANYSRVLRVPLRILFQTTVVSGQKNFTETMLTGRTQGHAWPFKQCMEKNRPICPSKFGNTKSMC